MDFPSWVSEMLLKGKRAYAQPLADLCWCSRKQILLFSFQVLWYLQASNWCPLHPLCQYFSVWSHWGGPLLSVSTKGTSIHIPHLEKEGGNQPENVWFPPYMAGYLKYWMDTREVCFAQCGWRPLSSLDKKAPRKRMFFLELQFYLPHAFMLSYFGAM